MPPTNPQQQQQQQHPLTAQQILTLRSLPNNNTCFECNNVKPDWASVSYGILLCLDCAGKHRGLGVHLSFVRSLTMDSWSAEQYRRMIESGGNGNWRDYWEKSRGGDDDVDGDDLKTQREALPLHRKYQSEAARAYREALTNKLLLVASSHHHDVPSELTTPDSTMTSIIHDTTSAISLVGSAPPVALPEEIPPTLRETIDYISPCLSSMVTSPRARRYWYIWAMLGFSSAYEIMRARGQKMPSSSNRRRVSSSLPAVDPAVHGYMGATTAAATIPSPEGYYYHHGRMTAIFLSLGILALFAGIPYFLFRLLAFKAAKTVLNHRQEAFKSARNLLTERIASGRAQRMERCDAYYPPASAEEEEEERRRAKCGLVFFPGALVDRAAYAPVAAKLSEAGVLVVVVNLEPHRMVAALRDCDLKERVMRSIAHSMLLCDRGPWTVDRWAIGGHSMGGHLGIAAVANELSSSITKIVLWGVSSYPEAPLYPCKPLRNVPNVQVLVVNGSKDTLVTSTKYSGSDKFVIFEEKMPPRCHLSFADALKKRDGYTFVVTVEGGNHAGCAHYGPQTFPVEDGVRTIALEEQQDQFAKVTADFLLGTE